MPPAYRRNRGRRFDSLHAPWTMAASQPLRLRRPSPHAALQQLASQHGQLTAGPGDHASARPARLHRQLVPIHAGQLVRRALCKQGDSGGGCGQSRALGTMHGGCQLHANPGSIHKGHARHYALGNRIIPLPGLPANNNTHLS